MSVMNECLSNLELDRDQNTQLNKVQTSENNSNQILYISYEMTNE